MPRTTLGSLQNNGPLSGSGNASNHLAIGSTPKEVVRRPPDYSTKIWRVLPTVKEENDNGMCQLALVTTVESCEVSI